MTKFDKVCKALEEKTRNSGNWLSITKNGDARHKGKYVLYNVMTFGRTKDSYNTLKEIIEEFKLNII